MNGGMTAAAAAASAVKSLLHKPLHELTEDDISQLTREDCRRFLKEKGMRRPSWNKSQAIQQVISLKSLLEPYPSNATVRTLFRPPPINSATTNNTVTVNSNSSSSVKELSPAEVDGSVTALMEDGCSNHREGPFGLHVRGEGECHADDTQRGCDRYKDAPSLQFDQMTVFYSGKVNVYDGVPVEKQARSILHLAASPNQFCLEEPSGENLPNLNTPCQLPSSSVKHNLACSDAPSLQSMQPGKIAGPIYYKPEGINLLEQDVESQTNRQVSLQRYLEKRKDRGKFKMKRKTGTSSTGLEMYLSHQMNSPVTSRHSSERNACTASQLEVPQSDYETKEKHLKNPGLSVDLNDKGTILWRMAHTYDGVVYNGLFMCPLYIGLGSVFSVKLTSMSYQK